MKSIFQAQTLIAKIILIATCLILILCEVSAGTLYDVLGVTSLASPDDIKKSYRMLAMKFHPDKNKDDPNAHSKFVEISNAYEILGDQLKRRQYDAELRYTGQPGASSYGRSASFNDWEWSQPNSYRSWYSSSRSRRGSHSARRDFQEELLRDFQAGFVKSDSGSTGPRGHTSGSRGSGSSGGGSSRVHYTATAEGDEFVKTYYFQFPNSDNYGTNSKQWGGYSHGSYHRRPEWGHSANSDGFLSTSPLSIFIYRILWLAFMIMIVIPVLFG